MSNENNVSKVCGRGHKAYYSVYRRADDMPIIIHGTKQECANAMGIKMESFKHMAWRHKNRPPKGLCTKYEIVRDEDE